MYEHRLSTSSSRVRGRRFAAPSATLAVLLMSVGLTGCDVAQMQEQNHRLHAENRALQDELEQARRAHDALYAENEQLRSQVAGGAGDAAPQALPRAATTDGFAGIAGVETEQTAAGVTVRVPGDVLFAPGQAEVQSGARSTLQQIARALQDDYRGHTIRVEGYTDTDPIQHSPWADNLELSSQRAMAVYRYLVEQGVSRDRMYAAGFGAARPRETKEQSRRVEIVVVKHE